MVCLASGNTQVLLYVLVRGRYPFWGETEQDVKVWLMRLLCIPPVRSVLSAVHRTLF